MIEWQDPEGERWQLDGAVLRIPGHETLDLANVARIEDHLSFGQMSTGFDMRFFTDSGAVVELRHSKSHARLRRDEAVGIEQFRRQIFLAYGHARPAGEVLPGGDTWTRAINTFLAGISLLIPALMFLIGGVTGAIFIPAALSAWWFTYGAARRPMRAIDVALAFVSNERKRVFHDPVSAAIAVVPVAVVVITLLAIGLA